MLCSKAFTKGMGVALMKEGNVIFYESGKLKDHKKNYVTHDLELATIVNALKVWRHYVMGRKFERRTNHMSLKYLFDLPNLNSKQEMWLEFLREFEFDIKHVKRKENKVAQTLKTKFHIAAINICRIDLKKKFIEPMTDDEFYLQEKK